MEGQGGGGGHISRNGQSGLGATCFAEWTEQFGRQAFPAPQSDTYTNEPTSQPSLLPTASPDHQKLPTEQKPKGRKHATFYSEHNTELGSKHIEG